MTRHEHRMLRHQIAIRRLEVLSAGRMTPPMPRITLPGEASRDFASASPDDRVALQRTNEGGESGQRRRLGCEPQHPDLARMAMVGFAPQPTRQAPASPTSRTIH
ncbi:hypothetical protein [Dyella sp.]|uniref:hypothetical protein n=1 Tax=Dyella sp. TaxID=1869338 RepID=UPI002B4A1D31|nr:hypothetical protein [Dyella sp.]HKT30410.1 hypothetical protein [Dyella sp.]